MATNGEQVRTWPFSKHYPDICLEGKESKFSGIIIIKKKVKQSRYMPWNTILNCYCCTNMLGILEIAK
jgi:hypothetical protein